MTAFPEVLTAPATTTFTSHDGILISHIGEDGHLLVLGHHAQNTVEKALDSFDRDWRGYAIDEPQRTWAVLVSVPADTDAPWWVQWWMEEDTPGAFPVMVVEA